MIAFPESCAQQKSCRVRRADHFGMNPGGGPHGGPYLEKFGSRYGYTVRMA